MIDHTGIGVADVARSAAFYDAAGALGLTGSSSFQRTTGPMASATVLISLSSGLTAFTHTAYSNIRHSRPRTATKSTPSTRPQ